MRRSTPDGPTDESCRDDRRLLTVAMRLSELAARSDDPERILDAAAETVLRACDGLAATFYWIDCPPSGRARREERLRQGGSAAVPDVDGDAALARRMYVTALAASGRSTLLVRPGRMKTCADAKCGAGFIALPLGEEMATAVLVVSTQREALQAAASLVQRIRPALGAVVQSAYLRKELERAGRQHTQMHALFSHSSEAILTVDRRFHIVEANPALGTLLEQESAVALGKHCSQVLMCRNERGQLLCGTDGCPLAQAFVLTNSAPYREVVWPTRSGKSKEVSASFAAIPSPEGLRGVIIARDMTPVNAANRMRSNFISMVSHELRTPLNSINGFLEIVLEGHVGTLTSRQEEFLNYARTSTHQLMTLVEDILFISRADTGQFKLRFAKVAIPELVAQVVMNLRSMSQTAQVTLHIDIPEDLPQVYADDLRLQQVLTNLINNAIKFTPPGGCVTVSATRAGGALRVEVSDTGEGIPLEDQERIFERFYQSPSHASTKAGGYGLGLAIAKLIVEQHGGHIWVRSRPDGGSTFTFTVPFQQRASIHADEYVGT
ncbi:MAG TPA: PAS domain-containing sensor histidine kinase [Ktedonobacterales bacterium]